MAVTKVSVRSLLMCLAWSEETMSPQRDRTETFVTAMEEVPGDQGSAVHLGLSVAWDVEDMQHRLKHLPFSVPLIDWDSRQVLHGKAAPKAAAEAAADTAAEDAEIDVGEESM